MQGFVFLNHRWCSIKDAQVPYAHRALLYADGVFETIRIEPPHYPLFWSEHKERLQKSAQSIGLRTTTLTHNLTLLYESLPLLTTPHRLRIQLSRTDKQLHLFSSSHDYELSALLIPCQKLPITPRYQRYKTMLFSPFYYLNKEDSKPKTIAYHHEIYAQQHAQEEGFDDFLKVDLQGFIYSGSTSNFFWIHQEQVFTPPLCMHVRDGVTRRIIMALVQKQGLLVEERSCDYDTLQQAEEVFLTSSIQGIVGAKRIDDIKYTKQTQTRQLYKAYCEFISINHIT